MSVKRYSPRSVRDCDGDWFSTGNEEKPDGIYVPHSDYASLLSRHAALVEAVKWMLWIDTPENFDGGKHIKARAEVERLLSEEK